MESRKKIEKTGEGVSPVLHERRNTITNEDENIDLSKSFLYCPRAYAGVPMLFFGERESEREREPEQTIQRDLTGTSTHRYIHKNILQTSSIPSTSVIYTKSKILRGL